MKGSYYYDFFLFQRTFSLELALIEESTQILLNEYSKQCADAEQLCVNVTFTSSGNTLRVSKKGEQCTITCHEPAHYFRCLNYLIHHLDEDFLLIKQVYSS
mgnify:CR=1 FL=1